MKILLYAGPSPERDLVLLFSAQIIEKVATALSLVAGGGKQCLPLLRSAVDQLHVSEHIPITLYALPGDAQTAILTAAREQSYDLVIFGRFHQPLGRLFPGPHSKTIAQRLEPSVLRVHGGARPIRRILLASGGDHHTFNDVRAAARLAVPLEASVTILHVLSQQPLTFNGLREQPITPQAFLGGTSPEAGVLRASAKLLDAQHVPTQLNVRVGPILDEILDEVRTGDYELLVIGAHRVASALDRILLEDITGDLLDLCPVAVLVVKETAHMTPDAA